MTKNGKILLAAMAALSMTAAVPALAQQSAAPQSQNQSQAQPTKQNQARQTNQTANPGANMIRQAQQALNTKGFNVGRVDGKMGRETRQALRNFQNQQKLQPTGRLDNQTMAALGMSGNGSSSRQGTIGQGGNAPRNNAPRNNAPSNNPAPKTQNQNQSH
jgi:peptidoglycan hydrolase-like protein with peptidoglycan-binding domain